MLCEDAGLSVPIRRSNITFPISGIGNHKGLPQILEKLGTNNSPRYGYNLIFLNGRWISVAATFNKLQCEKTFLPVVEFDGENECVLPTKCLRGDPYIQHLEKLVPEQDLPY